MKALTSSIAQDRKLADWYTRIKQGQVKLPRFQRHEAWDRWRVKSFMQTVIQNLPVGVTLILEVGDKEQFASRYIVSAERDVPGKITEHLLDGQQRLTAFWRTIHNNYGDETYFVYIPEFDTYNKEPWSEEAEIFCRTRYLKDGQRYPLWADNPKACFARGCIPLNLLKPKDIQSEVDAWIEDATESLKPREDAPNAYQKLTEYFSIQKKLKETILEYREIVSHFNLPFLALPNVTSKEIALQVFINMNTNSKPLTVYDYIVAEVESVKGASLHQLQEELNQKYPKVQHYYDLEFLILATSALLQDKLPNNQGMFNMDKEKMVENWELMEQCLGRMTIFMESQGIFDRDRLPTNAVLAVVAATYSHIPEAGDFTGKAEILLKKYLWSSFFTDRYENAAATKAFYDYMGMKRVLTGVMKDGNSEYTEEDIPVLNRKTHELADVEELLTVGWPKKVIIRARGILAITTYLGALDFADGQKATREHLQKREYHHIFPESLLEEAGIDGSLALNCALVTAMTNKILASKDPLTYLKERYDWSEPDIVNYRLHSHLIPVRELSNGGYEGLEQEEKHQKIRQDFDVFLKERARLIYKAITLLTQGKEITSSMVMQDKHHDVNWKELIAYQLNVGRFVEILALSKKILA